MIQVLASLATKNTDSLIGAVARVLEGEGSVWSIRLFFCGRSCRIRVS